MPASHPRHIMASIRTERRDCRSHQSSFSIDHHLLPSLSHLRTSSEAWQRSSSPQGTLSCVRLSQRRLPDPTWKRRPDRPRGRWIDQLQRDNNRPPAVLINGSWLLSAVTVEERRYGLTTTRLPDLTWPEYRRHAWTKCQWRFICRSAKHLCNFLQT